MPALPRLDDAIIVAAAPRRPPAHRVGGRLAGTALLIFFYICVTGEARADVIDEVRGSGVLVAGTRADSPPFGFPDAQGRLVGFSVDILNEIAAALGEELQQPVRLELKTTTPESRMDMIRHGQIQIECGITTPTWARLAKADFSIPFFVNGTRILTHRALAKSIEDLSGKRIGVVADGTTRRAIEDAVSNAVIVEVPDMSNGITLFRSGQIDALSNISVVLRGLLDQSDDKGNLRLLPRDGAIQYEPIACMLPRDDSAWHNFVDGVIARELKGAADYEGRYVELYNKWFGPGGRLPMPLDREVVQLLIHAAYWID
jgi:polar amino acid transport system substrate-binding protein